MESFSLAFYDIIDITPGSNSDFIRSLPNDAISEMKQFGSQEEPSAADDVKELIVKFIKVYTVFAVQYSQIYRLFYNYSMVIGCLFKHLINLKI